MVRARIVRICLVVLTGVMLAPAAALAQSAITGVARDASGGIMPGVTVTVSSPALIEKQKTAVTDADGLYRIVDLRPGVYSIAFELPGFQTFKRDGLTLEANFTATVN